MPPLHKLDHKTLDCISPKASRSILGGFQHCTSVLLDRYSHLPSIHKFTSSSKDPSNLHTKQHITSHMPSDIIWWRSQRSCKSLVPPDPLPNKIFVDASTSFGIGLVFDGLWLSWKLLDGWKGDDRDINWAEMVAIDLGLRTIIHAGFRNVHLIFHSDNQGVVKALKAGRSRNAAQNFILCHIISAFREFNIWLTFTWVKSKDNISDAVSRGHFPPSTRYASPPPLPSYLKHLVALA